MKMSLTIKARLGLTMAFLGLLLVAIGGLGLYGMNQSNHAYRDTFENQMPSANAVSNAELYAARERLVFDRAAFLAGTPEAASTIERGADDARPCRRLLEEIQRAAAGCDRKATRRRLERETPCAAEGRSMAAMTPSRLTTRRASSRRPKRCRPPTANCHAPTMRCASSSSTAPVKVMTRRNPPRSTFRTLSLIAIVIGLAAAAFLVVCAAPRDRPAAGRGARALRSDCRRRSAPQGQSRHRAMKWVC